MSSDVVIKVENLSKTYLVYDKPQDRLKQSIYPRLQRLIGMAPRQYYQEFHALEDVSFEVRRGETVGIIGKNGSGKSTLLQMICSTLQPTSGRVETSGRIAALLELGSGFNPEFTGRDNVYMYAAILGLSEQEVNERYDSILEFADIGEFIEQPTKTYSSGMVVRLAFAVITHVDADVLIIDEALSVGDAFFVQKCMRFLRAFMKSGTVLFVSHDTGAVLNLCQRAILLDSGKVVAEGRAKELTELYLESLHAGDNTQVIVGSVEPDIQMTRNEIEAWNSVRDMRQDFINGSNLRNDLEVFLFEDGSSCFGVGGAEIAGVVLCDSDGKKLSWVVGGEFVVLSITVNAGESLISPIVGFQVKDRLGQVIFAENTYIVYANSPVAVKKGGVVSAKFSFYMPVLPVGYYSIGVAIADGTQDSHVQHHWIHDAMIFKVHSSKVCFGLVGVPMIDIQMVEV